MRRLLILIVGALSLGAAPPPQPSAANEQNQSHADLNASTTRLVDAINNVADEKDAGCENREDKRSSDLCAQWKAADAARDAADYTFLAVLLSFIGTVLVAATFWEQRKVSRAELRAYLEIEGQLLMLNEATGEARTDLKITNNGQTPAFNTRWAGNIVVNSVEQMERDLRATLAADKYPEGIATVITIHGHTHAVGCLEAHPPLKPKALRRAIPGEGQRVFVFGTVWYEDTFKRRRYTNFCFATGRLPDPNGKRQPGPWERRYEMMPFHNDSN